MKSVLLTTNVLVRTASSSNGTLSKPYRADNVGLSDSVNNDSRTGDGDGCVVQALSCTDVRVGLDLPSKWLIGQFSLVGPPRWVPPTSATEHSNEATLPPSSHSIAVMLQNQDENRNVWSTLEWDTSLVRFTPHGYSTLVGVVTVLYSNYMYPPGHMYMYVLP